MTKKTTKEELDAAFDDKDKIETERETQTAMENLSIRERLLARAKIKTFKHIIEDEHGEYVIESRMFTASERYEGLTYYKQISEETGVDEEGKPQRDIMVYNEAMLGLQGIVQRIVVTPGLEGVFEEGLVTDDVIFKIFNDTLIGSMEAVGESLTSFRAEPSGPDST